MSSEAITRNDLTAILSEVFQPVGNIRQIKTDVAVPAISGGGYTTVAVPSPSLDVGEVVIGNRLIETDAALQVTLRYSNGWWLNASNEYSGTASAHNVEVWWVVLKNGAVTGVNDYIVEQGNTLNPSSVSWWYRKWNSGRLETGCYWTGTVTSYTTVSSFGGFNTTFTFPTSVQPINANYQVCADIRIGSGFAMYGGALATKTTSDFKIYYLSTASGSQTGEFWISVTGKWK